MNIQQLEYIIAVDNQRHFGKAAEICHITQPTLSMMIQKLEEELGIQIFDRSKHPIEPTSVGKQVIEQAIITLKHIRQIKEVVENEQGCVKGVFKMGIIPTIAPYIVPNLLKKQTGQGNEIELVIKESTTNNMIEELLAGTLDGGLLAGPLNHAQLVEYPLYYEKFYAYVSKDKKYKAKEIDLDKVDINQLWLLENVHCLRGQIEHLCRLKKQSLNNNPAVRYEAGSIDTLINIVDYNDGMTIIPELSAMGLSEERQENLRQFKHMTAVREVSLVVSKEFVRHTMLQIIADMIKQSVPKSLLNEDLKKFVVGL